MVLSSVNFLFQAYLEPLVERSSERFSWARPSMSQLHRFVSDFMAWPKKKVDEIMVPIMKRIADGEVRNGLCTINFISFIFRVHSWEVIATCRGYFGEIESVQSGAVLSQCGSNFTYHSWVLRLFWGCVTAQVGSWTLY